jgi:hypothetical protein
VWCEFPILELIESISFSIDRHSLKIVGMILLQENPLKIDRMILFAGNCLKIDGMIFLEGNWLKIAGMMLLAGTWLKIDGELLLTSLSNDRQLVLVLLSHGSDGETGVLGVGSARKWDCDRSPNGSVSGFRNIEIDKEGTAP